LTHKKDHQSYEQLKGDDDHEGNDDTEDNDDIFGGESEV